MRSTTSVTTTALSVLVTLVGCARHVARPPQECRPRGDHQIHARTRAGSQLARVAVAVAVPSCSGASIAVGRRRPPAVTCGDAGDGPYGWFGWMAACNERLRLQLQKACVVSRVRPTSAPPSATVGISRAGGIPVTDRICPVEFDGRRYGSADDRPCYWRPGSREPAPGDRRRPRGIGSARLIRRPAHVRQPRPSEVGLDAWLTNPEVRTIEEMSEPDQRYTRAVRWLAAGCAQLTVARLHSLRRLRQRGGWGQSWRRAPTQECTAQAGR